MSPLHFTGQAGGPFSCPLQTVPAYGSSSLHYGQSFSASMTPTASRSTTRTYGFQQVSVALYRAVFRPVALAERSSYAETVLLDSPVLYCRLDDGGVVAVDSSGNNKTGTLSGGITTGVPGATRDGNLAMMFNGSSGYISVPDSQNLRPNVISAEAWIYPTNDQPNSGNIISKDDNQRYRFRLDSGSRSILFYCGGNSINSITALPLTAWTHVVCVGDASGLKIFLNGVLDKSNAVAFGAGSGTGPLEIGADVQFAEYFLGRIDEVAIYNYALTPAQILSHYNAGLRVISNLISVQRTSV